MIVFYIFLGIIVLAVGVILFKFFSRSQIIVIGLLAIAFSLMVYGTDITQFLFGLMQGLIIAMIFMFGYSQFKKGKSSDNGEGEDGILTQGVNKYFDNLKKKKHEQFVENVKKTDPKLGKAMDDIKEATDRMRDHLDKL